MEKKFRRRVGRLRRANPTKTVEVWAQDEARLGLKPTTRRVWARKGARPTTCGRTKFEWVHVYGFARPSTGQTFTRIFPKLNTPHMTQALAEFAAHADPDGKKILVLIVDNAGWHVAKKLAVPTNVRLHYLPPCTPELQPVEAYWPLIREAVANETFDKLVDLQRRIARRCRWLAKHPDIVKGVVGFHWAINLENKQSV